MKAKKEIFKFIIILFLIWRVFVSLAAYVGVLKVPFVRSFPYVEIADKYSRNAFLWPWANFDGEHYLYIAEKGYGGFEQAFFPLYPLTIRFLGFVFGGNYLFTGLFISNICFLISLFLLYRLVRFDFDKRIAKWTIVLLLLFPASFFFGAVYTESLFLMLVLLSFWVARTGKWWLAGLAGMLAGATRFVGIFLLPAIAIEFFRTEIKNKKLDIGRLKNFIWILIIPLGLAAYMAYLVRTTGDALAFIHSLSAFGVNRTGGEIILLPQVFWRYFKIFFTASFNWQYFISCFEFFITICFLTLLVYSYKKIRLSYVVFSFLVFITPTLTGTFSSIGRYVLVIFPCFIVLALIKNRIFKMFWIIFSFILLIVLTVFFTSGHFVS